MTFANASRAIGAGLVTAALAFGACASDTTPTPTSTSTAGLALTMEYWKDAAIAGFRFDVKEVACHGGYIKDPLQESYTVALEEFSLPDFIPASSFSGDSDHAFADHFFTLPEGCYAVKATPVDDKGKPVHDCKPGWDDKVKVWDGQTTEILLIAQCEGDEVGGLDVIGVVNEAPTLISLDFNPSKFNETCDEVEVCATAIDPDGDPLKFVWKQKSGAELEELEVISHTTNEDGSVTECARFIATEPGAVEILVKVFDMMEENGAVVDVEEWMKSKHPEALSSDSLLFPLYFTGDECEILPPPECTEATREEIDHKSKVDGKCATIVIPEGACPVKLSFTSYALPYGTVKPFEKQWVFDNVTDVYGPGTHEVCIKVPKCAWQTDLYLGKLISHLDPEFGHPADLLIDWALGGYGKCGYPQKADN